MKDQPALRVCVTGPTGFLGPYLLRELRRALPGARLVGLVRRAPAEPLPDVEYTTAFEGADLVFHLAGGGGVETSWRDPKGDLLLNAGSTLDLLQLLERTGRATVVLASSMAVYGEVDGTVREDEPLRPISPYGVSKLAAERYVQAYARAGRVDGRIARIGNLYGPGQRRLVIFDLARQAVASRGPLRLRGSGTEVRDFVHATDVAQALVAIGLRGEDSGAYNVGSGAPVTLRRVAELVATAAGLDPAAVETDGMPDTGKVGVFLPSTERLASLGVRAAMPLERGIQEPVSWARSVS
ncbi:MAG: SDR family oxidoreductase [Myxococcales bacterium]|nr:SDR family oxidoreductase [Myxococcales bacterium]